MTRRAALGRGVALGLVALAALGPVAACSDDGPKTGQARLEVDGKAALVRQGGDREVVVDEATVRSGDSVTLQQGTGTLHLRGGTVLELRAGAGSTKGTTLVMGPAPVLRAGDLLVTAPDVQRLSVDDTRLEVRDGSARIGRSTDLAVAAYDGDVALDSAGQERAIPALREMRVPALGLPPEAPVPLAYDANDPWDRRFLGEAIDLGQRLESLATGYTRNLSKGDGRTVTFYEEVLPDLAHEPEFTADLLDARRPPGETLIGAAIADLGRRGTFTERWRSVFAFRDQGAAWGLVALDQGVDRAPLLGAVTGAVQDTPLAIGPVRPRTEPTAPASSTTPTTVGGSAGPTTTSTTAPPTSPTTTVPPDDGGGGGGLLSPVLDPVTSLLSGVLKALLGGLGLSG